MSSITISKAAEFLEITNEEVIKIADKLGIEIWNNKIELGDFYDIRKAKIDNNYQRKRPPIERTIGYIRVEKYKELDKIPTLKNFKHFINCEVSPELCPMTWEELEKFDEEDKKRFCKFCENYVYKVDNEDDLNKYKNSNKCLAINENLLETLEVKWDEEDKENFKKRLKISKLFLLFKSYYKDDWKHFKDKNYDYYQILKEIIKKLLNKNFEVSIFIENNVDIIKTLDFIMQYIEDEELKNEYKQKKDNLINFINLENK